MVAKYPSIPEPTIKVESLRDAVLTIKQAFEVLTGQRGNENYRAVLLPELTAGSARTTTLEARIAALETALAGALRFDVAQPLTDTQLVQGQMNLRMGKAKQINGIDLDTILVPGLYDGSSLGHSPDGTVNWFYIEVWKHSNDNWTIQRATHLTDPIVPCYVRLRNGSTFVWGAWKRYTLT